MKRVTRLDLAVAAVTTPGIILYRLFRDQIAGKLVFIAPALVVVAGLFLLRAHQSSRPAPTLGLDMAALRASSLVTLTVTVPAVLGLLAWAGIRGTWPESARNLVVAVAIYPVWGIGQQAIFQGLLHGSLDRLGLGALFYYLVLERDVIAGLL